MAFQWGQNGQGGPGVIFLSTQRPNVMNVDTEEHEGQFYLWSPLMIFSLVMACVVGLILLLLLIYALFYYCMYGTCCCPGCFWCPQAPAPPCEEPVKVNVRRPSRSESCRSSCRSRSSSVTSHCSHRDHDGGRMVRINSCPSINGSVMGVQPMIIQTIPAPQPTYCQPAPLPPPAPSCGGGAFSGNSGIGGGELRVVIGDARPANTSSSNVIVYDMGRSNGGGVSLGGNTRSEYMLQSVDEFGGGEKSYGAFNDGFDRDDGGSCFSDGHRSAVIDIGKGGSSFYPTLPRYDD